MASLQQIQAALAVRLTSHDLDLRSDRLLADFNVDELKQSRETLVRKRLSQIASQMPKTARALGSDYETVAREFIASQHFQGPNAIRLDAIHFAKWLSSKNSVPEHVQQLADWEVLRIEWACRRWMLKLKWYQLNAHHRIGQRSWWFAWRVARWGGLWRLPW